MKTWHINAKSTSLHSRTRLDAVKTRPAKSGVRTRLGTVGCDHKRLATVPRPVWEGGWGPGLHFGVMTGPRPNAC